MLRKKADITLYFTMFAVAVGCFQALVSATQAGAAPEIILFNGKIVTVDRDFSYARALAIAGGKILAIGSDADVLKLAG